MKTELYLGKHSMYIRHVNEGKTFKWFLIKDHQLKVRTFSMFKTTQIVLLSTCIVPQTLMNAL